MSSGLSDLSERVALVTGASSGLGRQFAIALAAAGARVALAARRVDRLETLAGEIGGQALVAALDVTDAESVLPALEGIEAKLGPLDIVINNAGIVATGSILEHGDDDRRRVFDTNLDGAWQVARAAGGLMAARGDGGSIVNIASILGLRAVGNLAAYSAAKAGLISLTQSMALEFACHKIRVNALAPGYIETDLNRDFLRGPNGQAMLKRVQLRRFGEAADLDGALLLLASDAGRYMTGSVIVVDGGQSLGVL